MLRFLKPYSCLASLHWDTLPAVKASYPLKHKTVDNIANGHRNWQFFIKKTGCWQDVLTINWDS